MKLYKLTDREGKTRAGANNETQWGEGVTHMATGGVNKTLCSDGWIHAYSHPVLAVLMNPIHANVKEPRLWECEGEVGIDDGMECGCRTLTTTQEIELPTITTEQRVRFAIGCAWGPASPTWRQWAHNWLNGKDRSEKMAAAVATGARAEAAVGRTARARAEAWAEALAAMAWAEAWTERAAAAAAARATARARAWTWAEGKSAPNFPNFGQIAEWATTEKPIEDLWGPGHE